MNYYRKQALSLHNQFLAPVIEYYVDGLKDDIKKMAEDIKSSMAPGDRSVTTNDLYQTGITLLIEGITKCENHDSGTFIDDYISTIVCEMQSAVTQIA